MATFPSLTPSEREFEAGVLPVREYQTLAGVVWKRIYGDERINHRLRMTFMHIKSAQAAQITRHYDGQNTTVDQFALPLACAAGCDDQQLVDLIRSPDSCLWVYAGPYRRRDVFPGICTVTVDLKGELPY